MNDSRQPIQAVIFDFDGVIVETEPLHHQSFCQVVEPDGLACDWAEYVRVYIGFDDRDLFREAYRRAGRSLSDQRLRELVDAKAQAFITLTSAGVSHYEGVPEMIRQVAACYPVAICSGALRSDIDPLLEHLELSSLFPVRVTAEDVSASKPDPACYRLAVERVAAALGVELAPASCVAIEDTPTGIQAAVGAGLQAWGVTHTHACEELKMADRVFDSLREIGRALEGANEPL